MTLYHHILKDIHEKKAICVKTSWSLVEISLTQGAKEKQLVCLL